MNKVFELVFIFVFFASFSYGAGKVTGASEHEPPSWFKQSFLDISEDVDEATSQNKHLMLFIDLDGCPYCTKMLNESFKADNETSKFLKKHFDVINLNVKGSKEVTWHGKSMSEKEFATSLHIQYSPTILFLDKDKNVVLKLNGYRNIENFKTILEYINGKFYVTKTLSEYLETIKHNSANSKSPNKQHKEIQDLSKINSPLALIFDEKESQSSKDFNQMIKNNKDARNEFSKFTIVSFDANSDEEFIGVDGIKTTPKAFVKSINLDYRPGILLYNEKKLISTMDALLYSFHFKELLRYVSEKEYKYFDTYLAYLAVRQKELTDAGVHINLSK
ncbi:MAG: thioredoxin fold domain-containing protein [Epsilonproteobacteria bacterium]|nr:thioredoxin fold domain-containing protein [Campylobacterota bacterium]